MYYCKEFYSLSVLSLYEGELIGKVDKLYFDKNLKKLIEIELIGENDTKMFLQTKNIYRVGKNAITIKNNQAVAMKAVDVEKTLAPISSKAYSINGEFLGIVQEISLNEKFVTEKIVLDNEKLICVDRLASCGKNTIVFYDDTTKVNIKNFMPHKAPKAFKNNSVENVAVLPVKEEIPSIVPVEANKVTLIQNSDFLLGRVCLKDISNFNNELLIKAHGIINKKNLKEIIKFGKLRELMLFTK